MHRIENRLESLEAMMAAGCFHSKGEGDRIWPEVIKRFLTWPRTESVVHDEWKRLQRYPALLLIYVSGMAAAAGGRIRLATSLVREVEVFDSARHRDVPACSLVSPYLVLDHNFLREKMGRRLYLPNSEYVFEKLRDRFRPYLPDDGQYEVEFDRVEFLLACHCADVGLATPDSEAKPLVPIGRFGYKITGDLPLIGTGRDQYVAKLVDLVRLATGAGMFGGNRARREAAVTHVIQSLRGRFR